MRFLFGLTLIAIFVTTAITNVHMDLTREQVLSVVKDNGCASAFEITSTPQTNQSNYKFH